MKFIIRRFIFSILTAPIAVALYAFGYSALVAGGAEPQGTFSDIAGFIAFIWILGFTFGIEIERRINIQ